MTAANDPDPRPGRSNFVVSGRWVLATVIIGAALMGWAIYHVIKTPPF